MYFAYFFIFFLIQYLLSICLKTVYDLERYKQYAIDVEIDDSGQVKSGARHTEQGRSCVKLAPPGREKLVIRLPSGLGHGLKYNSLIIRVLFNNGVET